jgi:SAM-dependent methyltransferase
VTIDRTAAKGFSAGAAAYQRARPDYPPDAVAWLVRELGIAGGSTVVDLGAGTGKLTALLPPIGARLIAVEPVAAMRDRLRASLPTVAIVAGIAEAIPLSDGSVDAVAAAQAFHWFDGERALAEIRRVLRPGGALGLMWNMRDRSSPWVRELSALVDAYGDAIRRHETEEWRSAFERPTGFSPLRSAAFPNVQEVDEAQVVDRVASTSFIATLPDDERASIADRVRALVRSHPDTRGRATFDFPHVTRVYRCERL